MRRALSFSTAVRFALFAAALCLASGADESVALCRDCGRELPPAARFCPACGAAATTEAENARPIPPPPPAPREADKVRGAPPAAEPEAEKSPPAPVPQAICKACGGTGKFACRNCKGFGRVLCPNRAFHDYSGGSSPKKGASDGSGGKPSLSGPRPAPKGGSMMRIEDTLLRTHPSGETAEKKCPICGGTKDSPVAAPCPECGGARAVPCRKCGGLGKVGGKGRGNG